MGVLPSMVAPFEHGDASNLGTVPHSRGVKGTKPVEGQEHVVTIVTQKMLTSFLLLEKDQVMLISAHPDYDQVMETHGWQHTRVLEGSGGFWKANLSPESPPKGKTLLEPDRILL